MKSDLFCNRIQLFIKCVSLKTSKITKTKGETPKTCHKLYRFFNTGITTMKPKKYSCESNMETKPEAKHEKGRKRREEGERPRFKYRFKEIGPAIEGICNESESSFTIREGKHNDIKSFKEF